MDEALPSTIALSLCERERVHIPGAIQPFGALTAFALPTWTISYASANIDEVFPDADAVALLGQPIAALLAPKVIHDLRNMFQAAMISNFAERLPSVPLGADGALFDVLVHPSGSHAVAEFIPIEGADTIKSDSTALVKTIIDRLRRTTTFKSFLLSAARQVRAVTGYDRVMIYKFLEDESGQVVAEALRGGLPPFMDLHYPASDIPAQARALFLRNWLRMIPAVDYDPVAILSADPAAEPLDLTLSTLRSASPIHLQYLKNMGSAATLTVSIIVNDRLWGLIACHHETSRRISASIGAAVELFAQVFSNQIEAKQQKDELSYVATAREVHDQLIAGMEPEETIFQSLRKYGDLLRAMIPCDGLGVWSEGRFESTGIVPPDGAIAGLIAYLNTKGADRVFATDELRRHLPDALTYPESCAGLIAIPFSRAPRDFVLLFRREVIQTVTWGGNPEKAVTTDGVGIGPRASFAAWREQVRGRSLPWRPSEVDMAETLRISLLDVILRRANLIDRERRAAQESQLLLVAELNHRVKNVLAVISSLVRQSRSGAESLETFTTDLQHRIQALSVAHDQLTLSHWKAAPLAMLIEAEAQAWTKPDDPRLRFVGPPLLVAARAYQTLALVLHELMTNAAKYGALSVEAGSLSISWTLDPTGSMELTWCERNGPPVQPPKRRGFGTIVVEQTIPFELHGEARIAYKAEGVEARFIVPAEFVVEGEQPRQRRQSSPTALRADLSGKNLLLVEDSMMIALDAQSMLQNCGAEVEVAGTSHDARRAIELGSFDAAILDVNLYTETSFSVAEDLQARKIPFVFATGYGETISVPERFKDVQVVSKPYVEDALRAALAA